ncbi:hypothetical protein Tco_0616093 [Tanacetum coccineum]
MMSTPVFVDPEISTQADGVQSSRVLAPKSPHTISSPTTLTDITPPTCHIEESEGSGTSVARSTSSDSTAPLSPDHPLAHTTPTLVPILRRTTCMAMRVSHAMSPGLSASIAEVVAMSDLAFRDDEEEDEEIEESLDSDRVSEDAEDEGPIAEDEGLAAGDEGLGMGVESLSLGGDEVVPKGQPWAAPVVETSVGEPLGLGFEALRCREIALGESRMPSVFKVGQSSRSVPESERPKIVSALRQPTLTTWMDPEDGIVFIDVLAYPPSAPPAQTPPSPEWLSGSLLISLAPSIVPSPMISLTIPSPVASPATAETEGFLTELGARVEMQEGLIRQGQLGMRFSPRDIDLRGENWELRLQLAEERRARLELAEIVDSIRRGQGPRRDV